MSTATENRSGKKTAWIVLGVVAAIALIVGMSAVGTYNTLATGRTSVEKAWSDVETSYQRRADLIPSLVKIAQQASVREQEIIEGVVEARADALKANVPVGDTAALEAANAPVSESLGRLLAVVEAYPQVQSTQAFLDLQAQVEGTENRVNVARRDFNDAARDYNTRVVTFPSNIFAGMFGFSEASYFKAADGAEQAPDIDFGGGK